VIARVMVQFPLNGVLAIPEFRDICHLHIPRTALCDLRF
jgi:hypothetical protein